MQYPQPCNESAFHPALVSPADGPAEEELPSYEMLFWGEEEQDVPREEKKLTPVTFRKVTVAVSNVRRFHDGRICGQAAAVDCWWAGNEDDFFDYIAELVEDDQDFGLSWKIGFLLGMTDGVLRNRKKVPPEMPLKPMSRAKREHLEGQRQVLHEL